VRNNPGSSVADQRREQIAAAACDIIASKGFDAATIREIATAAGLHVPTMYQYVGSKDEILELVYTWVMEHLRTDVDAATRGCHTARQKVLATVAAMIENGNRYQRQVGVLNRELKSLSPAARQRVLSEYQAILGKLADLINEGIATGEFRKVEPAIAANWVEAICDVWPLRQFSVKRFGLKKYQQEAAAFIDSSLMAR
jgi:AcrR family transcriptional regulator